MEETLKLIQGHPGINLPPHLLAQLTQQSVRTEQEDVMGGGAGDTRCFGAGDGVLRIVDT
jgi:hypothetical protein